MTNFSVTSTLPILATRPTSLRPRSSSIRCSARSFSSARRSAASSCVFDSIPAAPPRAGDGPDRYLAFARAHQNFGARTDDLEVTEIEVAEEGRRIDAAQRAIQREGWEGEGRSETLRQHDLKDVAGADIILRSYRPFRESALRMYSTLGLSRAACGSSAGSAHGQRTFQNGDDRLDPLAALREGGLGANPGLGAPASRRKSHPSPYRRRP